MGAEEHASASLVRVWLSRQRDRAAGYVYAFLVFSAFGAVGNGALNFTLEEAFFEALRWLIIVLSIGFVVLGLVDLAGLAIERRSKRRKTSGG